MSDAPWVYIEDIGSHEGHTVTLKGWLYNHRSSGKLHFLLVRDGTGILQCVVFKKDVTEAQFALADHLPQESSLIVTGTVRKDERAPLGYELGVTDLEVVHEAEEYPITPKEHGIAFLLDHRHLWVRSARQHAVLRIRSEVVRACREYFDQCGFVLFDSPILTPAACEGTTTLFETPYFEEKAYLTQSGQLYLEAGALAFGKVYCFGPTFRAEKSKTRRHLMEFWMVEPEVAFLDLAGDMDLAEDFVAHVVARVLATRRRELEVLERDLAKLEQVRKPFPRITYGEALELLRAKGHTVEWGADFGADEETAIATSFDRPVLVHRYPIECKAFYMKADPADPRVALCIDMLAPEGYGEVIGGSQRIWDLALLEKRIQEHNLPRAAFDWYVDLRKFGSVPHSGFGMGVERTVSYLCGLQHLREAIPFPRMLNRLNP